MKNAWQTKKLGELCEIELGRTPSRSNSAFWDEKRETSNVWLSIADLLNAEDNIVVDSKEYVSDKGAEICKLVPKGTLLVSFKLTLGRLAFAGRDLFTNEAIAALSIFNERELSKEFLFYFLHFFDWVKAAENDVKLKGMTLNKAKLKEMAVHFPKTLAEQQRIVGLLDEAFAGIAAAQANAEKNLQNARALFASHLQSVFTQRGKGWMEKPFEELIESNVIGLTKSSRDQGEDKAWPYVKMNNITRDNRFDFSRFTCVDATEEEVGKYSLRDGDFLFNTRNSYELVGKSCIYESDSNDAVLFNNNIMRVRFKTGIDARFVLLAFSSKAVSDELTALKSGTTNVSAIYFKDLKSLIIPIPPIFAQKAIAEKLDGLSEETQRLTSLYKRKLTALTALKQSLLHQAFTGNL
ncbi:MAG TPA: restriction endonuclease subunit S [Verrucomicrobiae bacterium]|nr:restriction endonuclease subunit S [Verrucomicrobiae bacterium]